MDANASPRNPYVVIRDKSSNFDSLDVVNLSARIGKSSFWFGRPVFNAIPASDTQCSREYRNHCLGSEVASSRHP